MKPSHLPFAAFAESVKPSGAVNRFPGVGAADDVYTYSVYMNGALAAQLPAHATEHSFKDVTLQALTEKLGLNPLSARDNLKVAELVALRSSWMSAVLENGVDHGPERQAVLSDFAELSKGMQHPWINAELDRQRELSTRLGPTLARAGLEKDVPPREVSVGRVVAQDGDFTLQETTAGEIVVHENRRLQALPLVGESAMVSYYRGSGQVVNDLEHAAFSAPYIDKATQDLAVDVIDPSLNVQQVVLFNNVQSYEQFVQAHKLDQGLVQQAFDARAENPKAVYATPARSLVNRPYIDPKSACLAIDYSEGGVTYTALFESAEKLAAVASEFGLGAKAVAEATRLEAEAAQALQSGLLQDDARALRQSDLDIRSELRTAGYMFPERSGEVDRDYVGKVVAVSSLHVAQEIGRGKVVIHDARALDKLPKIGDQLSVRFKDGRGVVNDMVRAGQDLGR